MIISSLVNLVMGGGIRAYSKGPPVSVGTAGVNELFNRAPDASGESITQSTAMNLSVVWRAVNLISGLLASIPFVLYQRQGGDTKRRATDHPLYGLLHDAPNKEMTSSVFRQTLQAHLLNWGNCYAEIERNRNNEPIALWPLLPSAVEVARSSSGELVYVVWDGATHNVLASEDVLHVPGLGFDGLRGYSVINMARQSLGLAAATEKMGAAFFGNGAWGGWSLSHPGTMSPEAQKNLRDSIEARHRGAGNAWRLMIFEEGMKPERMTMNLDDAQFLQTRLFQVSEFSRWYNVPPHKLFDLTNGHFDNIEHGSIEFHTDTMLFYYVRWEQEVNRKLLTPEQRRTLYSGFVVDGLLRADAKSRYEVHGIARQWGIRSANDCRKLEDEDPIGPEGDIYLVPSNMISARKVARDANRPDDKEEPERARRVQNRDATGPFEDEDEDDVEIATAMEQVRVRLAESHKPLLAEAVGRLARIEQLERFRATKGTRDRGIKSELPDGFYADHAIAARAAVMPAIEAFAGGLRATLPKADNGWEQFVGDWTKLTMGRYIDGVRTLEVGTAAVGRSVPGAIEARSDFARNLAAAAIDGLVKLAVERFANKKDQP